MISKAQRGRSVVKIQSSEPGGVRSPACQPEPSSALLELTSLKDESLLHSMRVRTCAWRHCRRVFFLCARCNRGNLYCSRSCAQRARRVSLRAAGQRYQRSRRGRFKHAARQASYRQRRRALQKVTHPSTQEPPTLGNVVSPTENTKHTLIPLSAGREHATKPQEFGSEQAGAAARATRQGASAGLSGRLMGASGGEEGARATTSLESPRPEWQCIRCQRSLSALRQTLLAVALPSDRA